MKDYRCKLEEGKFYHIYNRGCNREVLFYNIANYEFFLRRYDNYLSAYLDTYAFCLLPNHFHLLIRVKEEKEIINHLQDGKEKLSFKVSEQFHKLFTSYSKAINKQEDRISPCLFEHPFKRLEISNQKYLVSMHLYIHTNPQLH